MGLNDTLARNSVRSARFAKSANSARSALPPQLAALLTSLPIFSSTEAVNVFRAKEVGQTSPSSRFASCWKPNVAYLDLNFCPLWKKQTTLPSLAYAGIPYQVFGERIGALALMTPWSRLAMPRSGSGISAIFASTSLSPSASPESARRRSWRVSSISARSSSESKLDTLAPVLRADFFLSLMAVPPVCKTSHLDAPDARDRRRGPGSNPRPPTILVFGTVVGRSTANLAVLAPARLIPEVVIDCVYRRRVFSALSETWESTG